MGGKGETVTYRRLRAENKEEREEIKKKIIGIIDGAADNMTVVILVEEPKT